MSISPTHAATFLPARLTNHRRQVVNFHTVMGNYLYQGFGYREAA